MKCKTINYIISVLCTISAISQPAFAKPESVDSYWDRELWRRKSFLWLIWSAHANQIWRRTSTCVRLCLCFLVYVIHLRHHRFHPSVTTYSPLQFTSGLCHHDRCSLNSRNRPSSLFSSRGCNINIRADYLPSARAIISVQVFFLCVPAWQVVSPRCRYKDKQTAAWLTSD